MTYDEDLGNRLRVLLGREEGVSERRMFGGLAFLINGNLAVSASSHGGLMVRCAPEQTPTLVDSGAAEPMVMRGRQMEGWLRVGAADIGADKELRRWVTTGVSYARSLPPKLRSGSPRPFAAEAANTE